jgi:uncharacterized membrane protein
MLPGGEPGSLVGGSIVLCEVAMTHPDSATPTSRAVKAGRRPLLPSWRRDSLRTTLWVVPAVLVAGVLVLFLVTYLIDRAALSGRIALPSWLEAAASPDAGRQILIAIAAAVITVIGVVFSITILALTLASQQFGPRMLRNFVRDLGTQVTLGLFVATFVYAILALGSIRTTFVPHISITVALALVLADLVVLIYFIDHIARSIQLPEVIASIARDLTEAIESEILPATGATVSPVGTTSGLSLRELLARIDDEGVPVQATASGYLQFVGWEELVAIATNANSVIRLTHRPGHFVSAGSPLATVWPGGAAPLVAGELAATHITGAQRTLLQDPIFAIDQLVEIAIRALSPAVNDTFSALTCIDWLSDGLSGAAAHGSTEGLYVDRRGEVRLIAPKPDFARMVNRSFDKIRQSGRSMPAVAIRLMESLVRISAHATTAEQRQALRRQADMIMRASEEAIPEPNDVADVRVRYDRLVTATHP